jgi:phosphoadenosine phosphosulfate reductase
MLSETTLLGTTDLVADAIALLREHEPPEGYFLAFSGGKDSLVLKHLVDSSGVKYDAHYHFTSVDPPELVKYMREYHKDVVFDRPEKSMFQLIPQLTMPPTRLIRYCCRLLKENGGKNRLRLTGIRSDESTSRKKRSMIEKDMIHPIFRWSEIDVWEYIDAHNLPYCSLYDTGKRRLGCIMCPMQGSKGMARDAEQYPKFKAAYLLAFRKMLEVRKERGLVTEWETPEDVMHWWIYGSDKVDADQGLLFQKEEVL